MLLMVSLAARARGVSRRRDWGKQRKIGQGKPMDRKSRKIKYHKGQNKEKVGSEI